MIAVMGRHLLRIPGRPVLDDNGRKPRTHRGKLRRAPGPARVGRRRYSAAVTVLLNDGTRVMACRLGETKTRIQAKKLLKRWRNVIPEAYLWVEQAIL